MRRFNPRFLGCCAVAAVLTIGLREAGAQVMAMPPSGAVESMAPPGTVPLVEGPSILMPGQGASVGPLPFPAVFPDVDGGGSFPRRSPAASAAASDWSFQVLPSGLIYRSYLAGGREPRLGVQFFHVPGDNGLADATLGGRVGLLRYGTQDSVLPEGWQLDLEGAAFSRLRLDANLNLMDTDFRFGFPLTFRRGLWEVKLGYFHLSSHLGDEYMIRLRPGAISNDFSKESIVLGIGLRPFEVLRLYGEAAWAFHNDGPAKEWEFQFGAESSPLGPTGPAGAPFFAIHTRLMEEVDYGGNFTVQAGWQWNGAAGQRFRTGFHYFNGKTDQAQFLGQHEQQIGGGVWYDY